MNTPEFDQRDQKESKVYLITQLRWSLQSQNINSFRFNLIKIALVNAKII